MKKRGRTDLFLILCGILIWFLTDAARIRAQAAGDRVTISVADNGPGIPDDQKPKIFDMFYTGSNRLGDSRRSLGLGLGLCRSIVAAHGGTLKVADNTPQGAVFSFTLPRGEVTMYE